MRFIDMKFFILLFSAMITFSVVGLIFNIKTASLNAKIQQMIIKTDSLRKENKHYELLYTHQTRLSEVKRIAINTLNMTPITHIQYVHITP